MVARLLVVDDEATARAELSEALRDGGFEVCEAGDAEEALEHASRQSFDVVISDIRMPGMDGIQLLRRLTELSPETMAIMVTAYGDMSTAIEALRAGASDYVLKPLLFDDILSKVARLVEHRKLQLEVRNLRRTVENNGAGSSYEMVGESTAMRRILSLIDKVAPTPSNVLVIGESGTGKELIARALHEASDRREAPFVPINCAAIPEALLESELFGHVKGAFTGAVANKEGLLKTADEGTIFLDEIGDMPMSVQAKLLRATESREIQPVGSTRRIPISARIVAATNRKLKERIDDDLFREDLYYRLAVVEIEIPALRERPEDIPRLVQHFVDKYNRELARSCAGVESEALRLLMGHQWKGNVRELENTIERAMILSEGDMIRVEDLPTAVRGARPVDPSSCGSLAQAVRCFERGLIGRTLEVCTGDKRVAAKRLGISLSSLYRKLEED
ncbi:MAG: sigma-54 dependent transcriptional regulator [Planctomycetota bacterium]